MANHAGVSQASAKQTSSLLLGSLFFLQWGAPGLWSVSFSSVLRTHGMEAFIPYAFACNAIAAFISPLFVGAMADREIAPSKLLRWLNWLSAFFLTLVFTSIQFGWGGGLMLAFMMGHALSSSPVFSLATSIVFGSLSDPAKNFGRLRVWGTIGWIVAGWIVSWVLCADASPLSGYASAVALLGIGFFTYLLPEIPPAPSKMHLTWSQRMGLDALALLKHHDHRIVYLTTVLITIPLAAFFPYTPLHLRELGVSAPTAMMACGQLTEIVCMLSLATLWKRVRLKWIFLAGLIFAILRFAFFTLDSRGWLIAGICMHGLCYTLYYITCQIYLAERIEKPMQARAQALLTLLISGVGNLIGYLGVGWWQNSCTAGTQTNWALFWWGLCLVTSLVAVFFIVSYHGIRGAKSVSPASPQH